MPRKQSVGLQASKSCLRFVIALFFALSLTNVSLSQEFSSSSATWQRADIDLYDVSADSALRFIAELYDLSLVTGQLPAVRVTLRLRNVGADEAFEAVVAATGLDVERQGPVVVVLPDRLEDQGSEARKVVFGPFPWPPAVALRWVAATGVKATLVGDDAMLLKGSDAAIATAVEALERVRQDSIAERVFRLGTASGEETVGTVRSLLAGFESASFDSTGHLLSVSALPATLERVASLLKDLTQTPDQFEIEVRVVEVSSNALKRIGAQGFFRLEASGGVIANSYPWRGLDDSSTYFPSPNDLATLGGFVSTTTGDGSGFQFGSVDGRGIGVLIEFLEQNGEARIMATPKVTALDNREAQISMVTTLRIPTFTNNAAFATTSVSGIEQFDVGTTLNVRPRRTEGGSILLAVAPEVSEIVQTTQTVITSGNDGGVTQRFPQVMRRRTETEVILDSGETLVIGGLVSERESESVNETPGLSKIPIIGRAFRHKGNDFAESELLIFVTPHLLPRPEERRDKVRVDNRWLPGELALKVNEARAMLRDKAPTARIAGVRALGQIDAEVLSAGLDVGHDVVRLGADANLETRVAAALFLLRRRPDAAVSEILRFADSQTVTVSILAESIAPHQSAALSELLSQSQDGVDLLTDRLLQATETRDVAATSNILEAMSIAAPDRAALMAKRIAADNPGLVAERHLIDALSGAPGNDEQLADTALHGKSDESRAYAIAGLARLLGKSTTGGASAIAAEKRLGAEIRRIRLPAAGYSTTESAIGWSGEPREIVIAGDRAGQDLTLKAFDLLELKAPDFHQLVGHALARIEVGAAESSVDPDERSARVESRHVEPNQMALRLVRLATIVFDHRVRGFPATGERAVAQAVRQEIRALEMLTGAACSTVCADAMIEDVLRSARSSDDG